MILKTGQVYRYEGKLILVVGKRRFKKRLIYSVKQVFSNGTVGRESEKTFHRGECKLVKDCKVVTFVKLPDKVKNLERFDHLVSRAVKLIKTKPENYKTEVAKLAICCSGFEHAVEGRQCNLRDFARACGLKPQSFNNIYRWVLAYYSKHYTQTKYKYAIPSAADATIVGMVREHQSSYKSYFGFNKKLDKLLERNMKAYLYEFRLRGLSL